MQYRARWSLLAVISLLLAAQTFASVGTILKQKRLNPVAVSGTASAGLTPPSPPPAPSPLPVQCGPWPQSECLDFVLSSHVLIY
ncbi:hypothetical protein ANCDUO_22465 [Ancylostoma duodenale]|uniref:Uncharacterized protein n=1 Tax=Ancylostoma duodenale TaxID=51022 RepID=A0A0C2FL38_9BILA|nr:hypothetical protein ANCDUO_22465 [Ancylostoma duodenale]